MLLGIVGGAGCSISSSSESKENDFKRVPSNLSSPSEKVNISEDSFSSIEKSSLI
ncbi:hypothetical protein [Clostridium beijerinckii]|uniref:hypothetical protein n=1 Tax=Clostridium beijerinckii TaxID=1520 RepID=UPI001D2423EF|nr:hypothetical protein [Clostridium beijerinckii]NRY62072.1 hypothetical protein [Clostridium beijerinckii]